LVVREFYRIGFGFASETVAQRSSKRAPLSECEVLAPGYADATSVQNQVNGTKVAECYNQRIGSMAGLCEFWTPPDAKHEADAVSLANGDAQPGIFQAGVSPAGLVKAHLAED
jgi:hypothetical protein